MDSWSSADMLVEDTVNQGVGFLLDLMKDFTCLNWGVHEVAGALVEGASDEGLAP